METILASKVLVFSEKVKGWVSFRSHIDMQDGISMGNDYYTFYLASELSGHLWIHYNELVNRNTFYDKYNESTLEIIFNEIPGSVKSFKTINYEGSQAKVTQELADNEYFNLTNVSGWYVSSMITNLEQGGITEFINKEGKWFGYVIGNDVTINKTGDVTGNYFSEDFSIQGIGTLGSVTTSVISGCMDPNAFNYNDAATIDDGSCIARKLGCTDASASNYNATANTDDGSCFFLGCMQGPIANIANESQANSAITGGTAGSTNFDSNATVSDGLCIPGVYGCTDNSMWNYNPLANVASSYIISTGSPVNCGSENCMCIPFISGCTDPTAMTYDANANTDDGSCTYCVYGCMNPTMYNYNANATCDDGSCIAYVNGCTDASATNYDPAATFDDGSCTYPPTLGCTDPNADNYNPAANVDNGSCTYTVYGCTDPLADNYYGLVPANTTLINDGSCTYTIPGCTNPTATNYNALANTDDGSCTYPIISGCTDATACNYNPAATVDDGSCYFCGDANAINYGGTLNSGCTSNCIYCISPTSFSIINQTTADTGSNNGSVEVGWTASTSSSIDSYTITWIGVNNGNITLLSPATTYTIPNLGVGTITVSISASCTADLGGTVPTSSSSIFVTTAITPVPGCTDGTGMGNPIGSWGACNYNPLANTNDGSCVYDICAGCNDPAYVQYCGDCWDSINQVPVTSGGSPWVGLLPGSCTTLIVLGCTDAAAFNYNVLATVDDGSCVAVVNGCTDINALNYNASANTNDGSCTYQLLCNIPDTVFRSRLQNHSPSLGITANSWRNADGTLNPTGTYIYKNLVNTIQTLNIGNLFNPPPNQIIQDLQGIECFTALTYLTCNNNQLTSLDISQNTALTYLNCGGNPLGSLDVSQNTALTILYCYQNQLSSLDVSQNTALTDLSCYNNNLTILDVSQNTALTTLQCGSNQITSLDVSNNTALTQLYCYSNQLTSFSIGFNQNPALTTLHCQNNQLTSLDVSGATALIYLECYNNTSLTSLDISQNTNLIYAQCQNNSLNTLTVGANFGIQALYCQNNQLTSLDVSGATDLNFLHCGGNPSMATLNIANTNIAGCQIPFNSGQNSIDALGNSNSIAITINQATGGSGNYTGCVPAGATFNY